MPDGNIADRELAGWQYWGTVGAPIAVAGSGAICFAGALVFRRYLLSVNRLAAPLEIEEPDLLGLVDEPSIPPEATAGFP